MKIKLSKSQWEMMGKKAGWMKKEAITKGDASKSIYEAQNITFDVALPQSFVDAGRKAGYEVVPHFVWIYPKGSLMGQPGPLTTKGLTWMATPTFTQAVGSYPLPQIDLSQLIKVD